MKIRISYLNHIVVKSRPPITGSKNVAFIVPAVAVIATMLSIEMKQAVAAPVEGKYCPITASWTRPSQYCMSFTDKFGATAYSSFISDFKPVYYCQDGEGEACYPRNVKIGVKLSLYGPEASCTYDGSYVIGGVKTWTRIDDSSCRN